jgi:hypothetical protein
MLAAMASRGIFLGSTRGGQLNQDQDAIYKRKLRDLGFQLVNPSPAAKPNKEPVAVLGSPRMFHVCVLKNDDYIAVPDLRSCTGLAVYDPVSRVGAAYHFGGHSHLDQEKAELGKFATELKKHVAELSKLQMWLFASDKCAFADKLLPCLREHGLTQTPTVMEMHVEPNKDAAFYLLGTGIVTNKLT